MPASISHILTATTPDNTSYEIRPSHWNSSHAFSLNAAGSEISGAFSNANGMSFGLSAGQVTGSYTVPVVVNSFISVSDNATSGTLARLAFTNLNGITLSLSTGAGGSHTIVGSHNALTSQSNQAFSAAGGVSAFQTLSFSNVNGATFSNNAGQVQLSYTVPVVTNSSMSVSDNATSGTLARLAFTNLNGMTLSLSTGAGGSHTVVGSYTVPSTAGLLSAVNISGSNTSSNLSAIAFLNANGVSFGLSTAAGAVGTITGSVAAAGGAQTGISGVIVSNTTYTSGTVSFSNANGISFGSSAGQAITASYTVPIVTNSSMSVSDNATSGTLARLAFTNLNGITLSLSTGAGGSHTVVGSYTVPIVTNSSMSVSDNATSGTLARLAFTNLNGMTLSLSTGAGGSHTVVGSYTVPTQTVQSQSNVQGIIVSNTTYRTGDVSFSNANGATFGSSAGQAITLSYTVPVVTNSSMSVSDNATSGTLARLAFTNLNGVTLSLSTGAGGSHTIVGSHNALTTARASTDAIGLNTANTNVTWTVNSSGISLNAVGYAGTGTTFAGTNISGSLTHNSVGINLSLSVPTGAVLSQWWRDVGNGTYCNTIQNNTIVSMFPFILGASLDMSNMVVPMHIGAQTTTNNTAAGMMISMSAVMYTRTGSSLSSFLSGSTTTSNSHSSNINLSAFTGPCFITMDWRSSTRLTPGDYWVAVHVSTSVSANTSLAKTISMGVIGQSAAGVTNFNAANQWGVAGGGTNNFYSGLGVFGTANTRASYAFSDMTGQGSTGAIAANLAVLFHNYSVW